MRGPTDMEWVELEPRPSQQRHRRIGGTELGVLMGANSFGQTPQNVYTRIVDGISSFQGNAYSERGVQYEPTVRAAFVANTGAVLQPHPGILLFEDCFAASLDDIAQRGGEVFPVDYKTASINSIRKWGPDGSDAIPENYKYQLVLYMAACNQLGVSPGHAELYAAFGEDIWDDKHTIIVHFEIKEYRHYKLARDFGLELRSLNAGREFWTNHIAPS